MPVMMHIDVTAGRLIRVTGEARRARIARDLWDAAGSVILDEARRMADPGQSVVPMPYDRARAAVLAALRVQYAATLARLDIGASSSRGGDG